jgi:hypothetical protein
MAIEDFRKMLDIRVRVKQQLSLFLYLANMTRSQVTG